MVPGMQHEPPQEKRDDSLERSRRQNVTPVLVLLAEPWHCESQHCSPPKQVQMGDLWEEKGR